MIFKRRHSIAASALLLATGLFGHAAPVHAGDVSNAELGCYIDTYAFDYPTIGECYGFWTPSTASNPSTAVFGIVGLTAGNYTFYWTDLGTGQVGVCASYGSECLRSIRANQSRSVRVTVVDNQTGASKTIAATAYYEDGYN